MRVLLVNNLHFPNIVGGAEISVANLAKGLRDLGCSVCVLSLGTQESHEQAVFLPRAFLNGTWPLNRSRAYWQRVYFQFLPDYFNVFFDRKLEKAMEAFNPDVLHTNNLAGMGDSIWKLARKRKIRIVHTIRDYFQMCAKQSMQSARGNCGFQCKKCKVLTARRRSASVFVDAVVGNSKFTLDAHLNAGYFRSSISRVISGGLDDSFLKPKNEAAPFSAVESVGYLGQVIKAKGIEDFLSLAVHFQNLKFVVAGDGPSAYVGQLKEKYTQNNIEWVGRVEPVEFLDSINVLCVPSKWNEPLPRVIYEAFSRGVPVIASDTGGHPEIMADAPAGYMFASGDVMCAAKKLDRLIFDVNNNRVSRPALIDYAKKYSVSCVSKKYWELYGEILLRNR